MPRAEFDCDTLSRTYAKAGANLRQSCALELDHQKDLDTTAGIIFTITNSSHIF